MKKERATNIEKEKRLFTIQGWLLEGVPDRLIIKQVLQLWPIELRQAERYVKEAYISWKKVEGVNIEMKREMKIAELKQLKRSLSKEHQGTPAGLSSILNIEKEIIKLEGIEIAKQIDITTKGESINYRPIFGELDSVFENDKTNHSEQ
jgi:predicted phage-related endonuclease